MKITPERTMRLIVVGVFTCLIAAGIFIRTSGEVLVCLIVAVCALLGRRGLAEIVAKFVRRK